MFSDAAQAQTPTYVPGAMSGQAGTSPSGGATYAVPITVPPGTTGVQPKIALQYDSQGGNGVAGVGWSIAGLSTISRCPTDLYYDANIDPVDYDDNDKFCLNGQRLIAINGTYGADGTEYRTSFASFQKVISYGQSGNGPTWFRVWKKNGEILSYGETTDSRIQRQNGSEIRVWSLSKIADVNGNYVKYVYSNDTATGEFNLDKVEYTGNDAQGLAPYNSVEFEYETRPDTIVSYHYGDTITQTKRLTNVKAYAEGVLARDYRLEYGSGATNRSRLTQITECATATICFEPTTFDWSQDGTGLFQRNIISESDRLADDTKIGGSGDFNGDGLTDLYVYRALNDGRAKGNGSSPSDQVFLANGDGTFATTLVPEADRLANGSTIGSSGDFNGDGLTDLYVYPAKDDGRAKGSASSLPDRVLLANGDGTFASISVPEADRLKGDTRIGNSGDFNGDGLTDLYVYPAKDDGRAKGSASSLPDRVLLANGDGTFASISVPEADRLKGDTRIGSSGDFNGDGLTDLYVYPAKDDGRAKGSASSLPDRVLLANGDGTFASISVPEADRLKGDTRIGSSGDFNGDGLTDLYVYPAQSDGRAKGSGTNLENRVLLAKGDGSFENINVPVADRLEGDTRIGSSGDFNGDGLTDLYVYPSQSDGRSKGSGTNLENRVLLAKGDGSFENINVPVADRLEDDTRIGSSGDFNGDGLTDFYVYRSASDGRAKGPGVNPSDTTFLSSWSPPDYLSKATNGLGLASEFTYKPMTDASVYTKGSGAVYPVVDVIGATQVVAEIKADNGAGGQNVQKYQYENLRSHIKGLGSLGFEKMIVTDLSTNVVSESVHSQDWALHHQGLLASSRTIAPNGTVMAEQTLTWNTRWIDSSDNESATPTNRCFRFTDQTITTNRDLDGTQMSTVTENTTYDKYGFASQLEVLTVRDGETHRKVTTNTYTHDSNNWVLGRLTDAQVLHEAPGKPSITRTSSFTYDTLGLLQSETIEPGSTLFHTKTNTRNAYGAITAITETWGDTANDGIGPTSRTSSMTYDAKVRYRLTETNPLGHTQTNTYHAITGLITSSTGPNGLTTSWTYDDFGRKTLETRADGTTTSFTLETCTVATDCPTDGILRTETAASGGSTSVAFTDILNRTISTKSLIDGKWTTVDTVYDALGRVDKRSEPYFPGDPIYWTSITYDSIGRPLQTTRPDGSTESVVYNGPTTTTTNALGQTNTVFKDPMGRTKTVTDNDSNVITYDFDAIGQTLSMTSGSATSTYVYDIRGNKVSDTDPDKGTWTYAYNALGLLVEQTDAKSQVTAMTYDVLGRMLTRIDDANAPLPALRTATWTYDTATTGIGKLHTVTSNGYTVTNSYDALGRPSSTTETIDSNTYTSSTTYDAFSRPLETTYPSGFKVENAYDVNDGSLISVSNPVTAETYWQRTGVDARGNVTAFTYGNGAATSRTYQATTGYLDRIFTTKSVTTIQDLSYTFDTLGNLQSRTDTRQDLGETFQYDTLNRVVQVDTTTGVSSGGTTVTQTVTYTANGNIATKSDVGTYTYGQNHATCTSGFAGPHAVTTVAGTKNATYCYDLNGNMTEGDGRVITYSAFDKPTLIAKGSSSITLQYGPDRARFKRVDATLSGTTTTIYAAGKAYEKIDTGGTISEKHYVGDFAVITRTSTSETASYLHRDHLGSVDTITDAAGAVIQRMSFDAWGKRREVNWQAMVETARLGFDTSLTTRGFTGHEMMDPIGLVHMNGRVYDAELGRFLSADPFVQFPTNLQSWNRYSYVLNNPLSFTDPSGYFLGKLFKAVGNFFKKAFRAFGKVVKKALNNPIVRSIIQVVGCAITAPSGGIGCAAISAGLSLAAGGSVAEAFQAAAFAFAQVHVWDEVGRIVSGLAATVIKGAQLVGAAADAAFAAVKSGVHGVVSGALSVAQGGSFQQGFLGGAVGAIGGFIAGESGYFGQYGDEIFENKIARAAISGAAGCAGSVLAGGKCANGAVTAAFASLFNGDGWRRTSNRPPWWHGLGKFASKAGKGIFGLVAPLLMSPATDPDLLISPQDVANNPDLVNGRTWEEVGPHLQNNTGSDWIETPLKHGDHAGQGHVFRQVGSNGEFTGSNVQWHPGSVRHFSGKPYWKVSNSFNNTGPVRLPAYK